MATNRRLLQPNSRLLTDACSAAATRRSRALPRTWLSDRYGVQPRFPARVRRAARGVEAHAGRRSRTDSQQLGKSLSFVTRGGAVIEASATIEAAPG